MLYASCFMLRINGVGEQQSVIPQTNVHDLGNRNSGQISFFFTCHILRVDRHVAGTTMAEFA